MKAWGKFQLYLWALLFMVLIPLSAFGAEERIEIRQDLATVFPIIIDQPGNYVLISDLIVSTPDINGLHQ